MKAASKKQHYDSKIRNRKLNTDGCVWMVNVVNRPYFGTACTVKLTRGSLKTKMLIQKLPTFTETYNTNLN